MTAKVTYCYAAHLTNALAITIMYYFIIPTRLQNAVINLALVTRKHAQDGNNNTGVWSYHQLVLG